MTNIQTVISQLVQVRSILLYFSVKASGPVLHPLECVCAFLGALGAVAINDYFFGRARIYCV